MDWSKGASSKRPEEVSSKKHHSMVEMQSAVGLQLAKTP